LRVRRGGKLSQNALLGARWPSKEEERRERVEGRRIKALLPKLHGDLMAGD
jgi:hypothetical protein